jgi:ABC-type antimicrobial peptide transport system permease subunit
MGVGIKESERNILDLELEEELVINYGVDGVFGETVVIKTEFDFWPNLVSEIPTTIGADDSALTTIHLLGSFNTILGLSKILTNSVKLGMYITLDEDVNDNRVIGLIQNKLLSLSSFKVNYFDDPSEGYFTAQQINYLMSTMHGIVIFSIIINIISISYYAFIVITQRRKELALYSVLGMKNDELKNLIIFELMVLIVSSLVIGIIASAFLSGMIINLLMSSSTIMATIAIELKYSFVISLIYVFSFLFGSYAITRLTIRRLFKKSINNLLRTQ